MGKALFPGLSLSFPAGSINVLVGPNGGGKTSILRSLLSPVKGIHRVLLDQRDISSSSFHDRSKLISYVGTSTGHRPHIRVCDLLSFSSYRDLLCRDKLREVLDDLQIDYLRDAFLDELSEGEYKRVFVAGGLLQEASWYVLDEPEEHLDPLSLTLFVRRILKMKTRGSSFVIACHNLHFACSFADFFYGISADSNLAFVCDKKEILIDRKFDSLFSCKFIYNLDTEVPMLIGPDYE